MKDEDVPDWGGLWGVPVPVAVAVRLLQRPTRAVVVASTLPSTVSAPVSVVIPVPVIAAPSLPASSRILPLEVRTGTAAPSSNIRQRAVTRSHTLS